MNASKNNSCEFQHPTLTEAGPRSLTVLMPKLEYVLNRKAAILFLTTWDRIYGILISATCFMET